MLMTDVMSKTNGSILRLKLYTEYVKYMFG